MQIHTNANGMDKRKRAFTQSYVYYLKATVYNYLGVISCVAVKGHIKDPEVSLPPVLMIGQDLREH